MAVVFEVGDKVQREGGPALWVWRVQDNYDDGQEVEAETGPELARIAHRATVAAEEAEKKAWTLRQALDRISDLLEQDDPDIRAPLTGPGCEDNLIERLRKRLGMRPPELKTAGFLPVVTTVLEDGRGRYIGGIDLAAGVALQEVKPPQTATAVTLGGQGRSYRERLERNAAVAGLWKEAYQQYGLGAGKLPGVGSTVGPVEVSKRLDLADEQKPCPLKAMADCLPEHLADEPAPPARDLAAQLRELTNQAFERARAANNPAATAVYLRLREQCRREAITL